ncbi:RES family NAD+ phosphorylase [Crenothrix sp.]|uniref:RES family NAD+ phosphorylase n=1 Tax=Crenothrix sp. TaxID=3100433 RepID=UPI00374C91DB
MIPCSHFKGVVYRAHHPMWAYTPLSGDGAKQHGGRFNRPGIPTLYTCLDFTTAWLEAQQGFPFKPQPMTLVAYQVDCTDIVELHDPAIQQLLGISAGDLACAWEWLALNNQTPPTWLLADKLLAEGIAGIVVRSFAPGCTEANRNLVLLDWSEDKTHKVQVIDDLSRLPNNRDSWLV